MGRISSYAEDTALDGNELILVTDSDAGSTTKNMKVGVLESYLRANLTVSPIVANLTGNVTGNASTATKIATITNTDIVQLTTTQTLTNKTLTSPTITGTGAIAGVFTGDLTGDVTGSSGSTSIVVKRVRFAEAVSKGDPIYLNGYNIGLSLTEAYRARVDNQALMPAFGVADADYTSGTAGYIIEAGELKAIDTSSFSAGDTLYVAPTGGLTNVKPTGTNLIQNVGVVARVNANNGVIVVSTIGRSNDVPNIEDGKLWVGNASGVATPTLASSLTVASAVSAQSAATLTTPRLIGGVSFNGSAAINLPGVNLAGTQDTSGTAAIANALANGTSPEVDVITVKGMLNLEYQSAPGTNTAPGKQGDIAYDDNYMYICIQTDLWKRVAIAGF